MSSNPEPSRDGDVNVYEHHEARLTRYWQPQQAVFFINGMDNAPPAHKKSAVALSKLRMCPVIGVFNESAGKMVDLIQCLGDKWQWDGHGFDRTFNKARTTFFKLIGNPVKAEQTIIQELSRNPAAASMFRELRTRPGELEIFAHSQGNLILSNVLTGLKILDGLNALDRFTVHSYGSPTLNWPSGFTHHEHGFTFDPVTWLALFDTSFSISKVGIPSKPEYAGVISHGFESYLVDDATFVVNRFRWGSFGMTANMDEEGLAQALANMGTNIPRVRAIFERLYSAHWSDVDDVAVLYLQKIKNNSSVLGAVKADSQLRDLLIKSMDEGYTSSGEAAAIELLKG